MSLLFIDGFDHYATADILKKWDSIYNSPGIVAGLGRRGGQALNIDGTTKRVQLNFSAYQSAVIIGFAAFYVGTDGAYAFVLRDGSDSSCSMTFRSDGRVQILTGSTLVVSSLPGVLPINGWCYVEAKVVFGATTGSVEVRINGSTVIAATNVNTANNGTLGYSNLYIGPSYGSGFGYVDDLYICDTAGTVNNDFLGDCRVDAYYPTSEGTVQAWTPTPAGTHYTTVDEATPNTTDYVSSATVGNKELFGVTDLVNTPLSIFGVQANSAAWKTDAGFRAIKNLVRISGVDYPSSDLDVNETSRYCRNIWDQNPATSAAWTDAAVNGAEFGVQVA